jgi:hypothetical protein
MKGRIIAGVTMNAWIIVLHLVSGDVILPEIYQGEMACEEAASLAVVRLVKKGKDFKTPTYSCRPSQIVPPKDANQHGHETGPATSKSLQPRPGANSDVFTLEEGEVILQWPANMSPESYAVFKEWLDLVAKKVGRTVDKTDAKNDSAKSEK